MNNMFLVNFNDFLTQMGTWFSNELAIVGVIVASIGFSIILLAKRLTKFLSKTKTFNPADKKYSVFLMIGLILIVVAFFIFIFRVRQGM